MASSNSPLLADRPTTSSSYGSQYQTEPDEQTSLLSRIPKIPSLPTLKFNYKPNFKRPNLNINFNTSRFTPTLPFTSTFHPTLHLRTAAFILLLPSFILFTLLGPAFSPVIVFLSFALARQLFILIAHFSANIVIIRIEVVHSRLKAASDKAREKWVKRSVAAGVDGVVLVGLLVTLAVVTKGVDVCGSGCKIEEAGVVLGFLGFGLLLISVPDFGNPELVTMVVSIEKPVTGILKLATSLDFGEAEAEESEECEEGGSSGKSGSRVHGEIV
ncbi:hypothetical protein ONS95_010661 [Cadophora gregata]|uniref:uncharacterized protein n=1 Tax=Cadophora gregata TaxID=51156 RepID=UPI0026DD2CC5|nr:uncharacterized protein ONS95_010661 [Cadophora gregata]KAK0122425.1 hypothetical protein ONS95_010661 [Cadophora gregata]KAK0127902.1 hypothetical protein ONS96_007402 [Cadophora gregata f. sp. sojae]